VARFTVAAPRGPDSCTYSAPANRSPRAWPRPATPASRQRTGVLHQPPCASELVQRIAQVGENQRAQRRVASLRIPQLALSSRARERRLPRCRGRSGRTPDDACDLPCDFLLAEVHSHSNAPPQPPCPLASACDGPCA
jgi:hypothetical protein